MGSDTFTYDTVSRRSCAALIGDITQTPKIYSINLRDLSGKVIRELAYTPSTQSWMWRKDNVYREGALLASVSATEGVRHYHLDHLGSPRLVTNRCGERIKFFVTNPFGFDATSSQDSERMRFTMHERDLGSLSASLDDIDNMHARSYMPYLGRFTSADLLRGDPYSPQSFNLFAYVQGNPMNRFDPFGLYEEHIDVKETDPCPGAPEGWSCGAWDAFLSLFRLQYWFGLGGTSGATGGSGYKPGEGSEPQQPMIPCGTSGFGGGFGLGVGGNGDAGLGIAGASAALSGGVGGFYDAATGFSGGGFLSGETFANFLGSGVASPTQTLDGNPVRPRAMGAFAGAGLFAFLTNARSVQQLSGHFETWSANVGVGMAKFSFTISTSTSAWLVSLGPPKVGTGLGLSITRSITDTTTTGSGCR